MDDTILHRRLAEPPRAVLHASNTVIVHLTGYTLFERKSAYLPIHALQNLLNVEQIIRDGFLEEDRACLGLLLEITAIAVVRVPSPPISYGVGRRWQLHDFPNAKLQNSFFAPVFRGRPKLPRQITILSSSTICRLHKDDWSLQHLTFRE